MSEVGRPTDATARIQSRQRDSRRRRWLRWAAAGLVLALLVLAVWVVVASPVLAASKVTVSGTERLTSDEVLAAAQVPLGTPLVRIDTAAIADRVAGLPPVAEVAVTRQWPNTIQIRLSERVPRLAIPSGGGYLVADANGVVFDAVPSASDLVVVEADPADQQVLVDVGEVFSALSPDTAAQVVKLAAPSRDGIELRLKDGSRVIWGSAEESELKSQVLDALLPLGGTEFNVSAPAFPTRR